MKLTNKQLEVVVDEIYNTVSIPKEELNKKLLDSIVIKDDEYLESCTEWDDITSKINDLLEKKKAIENSWRDKEQRGFSFGYCHPMAQSTRDRYIKHVKTDLVNLQKVHSKEDIERQVILSGNSEIPKLVKTLCAKLSKV